MALALLAKHQTGSATAWSALRYISDQHGTIASHFPFNF